MLSVRKCIKNADIFVKKKESSFVLELVVSEQEKIRVTPGAGNHEHHAS